MDNGLKDLPRLAARRTESAVQDRRAWVRYRVEQTIAGRVFIAASYRSLPAQVADISAGGVGLVVAQPLELGTRINVELEAAQLSFEILADVVRVIPLPDGTWHCGCALVWQLAETEVRLLLS